MTQPISDLTPTHPLSDSARLSLSTPLALTQAEGRRREFRARLIRAGRIRYADNSPGPFIIPAPAIHSALALGKFDSIPAFIDHAGPFDAPSLRNLAGYVVEAHWDEAEQAAYGTILLLETEPGRLVEDLFTQLLADRDAGRPMPDVGLSLVFWPDWAPRDDACGEHSESNGEPLVLAEFRHIESVDFVFQPAADGRVIAALQALSAATVGAGLVPAHSVQSAHLVGEGLRPAQPDQERKPAMSEDFPAVATPPASDVSDITSAHPLSDSVDWTAALAEAATDQLIASSGLPDAAQTFLRAQRFDTPDALRAAITAQRELIAQLRADSVVQVGPNPPRAAVHLGRSGIPSCRRSAAARPAGRSASIVRPPPSAVSRRPSSFPI